MKDLSKFESVKKALEQVVAESDVDNGTTGAELLCYFWAQEYMYDKARHSIQIEIARKQLSGNVEDIKALQKQLSELPKPKIMMEFKVLVPIPRIQGTKIITDGDKTYKISMENITSIFIPEDAIKLGLLEYDETNDYMKDAMGRDSQVIKLRIKKGLIDIAAPIKDSYDRQIRPKRAIVTAVSYRTMQITGELMSKERTAKRRRYGFDEQQ